MSSTVTFKIEHAWQPNSSPYEPEVEAALDAIKSKGLVERGWDETGRPGIIRHETGAEVIVEVLALSAAIVELSASLLHLYVESRKHHPETSITINISDAALLKPVLEALGSAGDSGPAAG
jgi:hypothetical protein